MHIYWEKKIQLFNTYNILLVLGMTIYPWITDTHEYPNLISACLRGIWYPWVPETSILSAPLI